MVKCTPSIAKAGISGGGVTPFSFPLVSTESNNSQDQLVSFLDSKFRELNSLECSLELPIEEDPNALIEAEITSSLLAGLARTFSAIQTLELAKKGLVGASGNTQIDDELPEKQKHPTEPLNKNLRSTILQKSNTTLQQAYTAKNSTQQANITSIDRFQKRVDAYVVKVSKVLNPNSKKESIEPKNITVNKIAASRIVKDTLRDRTSNK